MAERAITLFGLLRTLNKLFISNISPQPPISLHPSHFRLLLAAQELDLVTMPRTQAGTSAHCSDSRQGVLHIPCNQPAPLLVLPSVTSLLDIQIQGSRTPKPLKDCLFPSQRIIFHTKSFRKSKIILFTFSDFCFHKVFSKHAKATECLVGHDMQC